MLNRILIVFAAMAGVIVYDAITLRGKISRKEKTAYVIIMVVALYLGVDYVVDKDWYDGYDLVEAVFGGAAKGIDDMLKVEW
ncbi:hypothetical protein [Paenibacillus sp. HB172176]|uniref:hypothetical protein n=1 Tax=Paenibacillus sp. HB172176 TaxID=2493690 RepID=UPI00143A3310|nr:hypothetical protein [Paenibacillus sp. HB172176]